MKLICVKLVFVRMDGEGTVVCGVNFLCFQPWHCTLVQTQAFV